MEPKYRDAAPISGAALPPESTATRRGRPGALLRLPEVERRIGMKRTSIYKAVKAGTLPAPVRLGARLTAWREEDIDQWIESRVSTRAQS